MQIGVGFLRPVGDVAAPAEPKPAGLLQRFPERHGQASGRLFAWVGHAIGYDNKAAHQITLLHGFDNAMAALITPTIE
ncbi:hypothetical protein SDC9_160584 [bioreactor metagenome]|uniref:Uncharacterized protein n=1 Tax=bioreactor metagenome TaxID=1076179 RepID=A0A645FM46_9ZZZZ